MQVTLDRRLGTAAMLVRPGSRVADIGCDHGRLSAYLAQSGIAARVIAADIRPGPLASAQEFVNKTGQQEKITCRLGDGLSVVSPDEVDDIVIAGMGGETIAEILAGAPWTKDARYRFVFVPATSHADLRRWLYQNGFALTREVPIEQSGYPYSVMQAVYTGEICTPDPLFCAIGLHRGHTDGATCAYLEKTRKQLERELEGKRSSGRYDDLRALEILCQQIKEEVKRCRE